MACARPPERARRRGRWPSLRGRGVTLVELLVVIVVLGVTATLVGPAWGPDGWSHKGAAAGSAQAVIEEARHRAIRSGRAVAALVTLGEDSAAVEALPDGRLIGAERFGVDPLCGRAPAAGQDGRGATPPGPGVP